MTKKRFAFLLGFLALVSSSAVLLTVLRDIPAHRPVRPAAKKPAPDRAAHPPEAPTPEAPEVQDRPRERELQEPHREPFAGAAVVASREPAPRPDGTLERVRILRTAFKYPFIRVVETVREGPAPERDRVIRRIEMVADHVLVRLRHGMTEEDLKVMAAKYGASVRRRMHAPRTFLVALSSADLDAVPRTLEGFSKEVAVLAYAEPDYIAHVIATPNDPRFGELYGLHNTGQAGGVPDADIDAPEAWDLATGSRAVKVGVIDTGVDIAHEDLQANIWTNPGEIPGNGIDDDGNGLIDDVNGWNFAYDSNDPRDDHFHGTHVAGTIGAVGNNGKGVAGVCWQVTLVPIKFLDAGGSGTFSDATDAIYYATRVGAHLTSNSWGGGGFSQTLKDAIDDANVNGVLFVAAAGNDSSDTDAVPHYPSAFSSPNLIAVAATTRNDGLASFSNYGASSVDLGAPGTGILSTFPTVVTAAMQSGGFPPLYGSISGTSMATPHVSGVCALLKSAVPGFTHLEIKNQLLSKTDPVAALAGKCLTGGRLNAFQTLLLSTQPVLAYKQGTVDDDAVGGTTGNADGIINPGERIGLTVTLRNLGQTAASGVTATLALAGADPQVTLLQTSASYGTVPGIGSATATGQYLFDVAPGCPTPHAINLVLTIRDASLNTWTSPFSLTVDASYAVSGTVRLDGNPLSGATVDWEGAAGTSSIQTGGAGTYSFGALAGSYSVTARKSGYVETASVVVTVPPARSGIDFSFTTVTISGRVADGATGNGIAGATIECSGAFATTATTLTDGTYSISAVVGRSVNVSLLARKVGYFNSNPLAVTLPPSATNVNFVLQGSPDITVTPASFDVTANLGETPTRTLTLGNVLSGPLNYRFENHASAYAVADRGDILKVLLVPGHGIVSDGQALWTSHYTTPILDRVDPKDGFLIGQLDLTGIVQRPWALAWDGSKLWVADQATSRVYCIDPATRTVVRSFASPEGLVPAGLDYAGNALYVYIYRTIYKLDPVTGQTLSRIPVPLELNVNDITLYNGSFWCASNTGDLYKLSAVDGSILATIRGPDGGMSGVRQLWGIGRDSRGSLWVSSQNGLFLVATGELDWLRETPGSGTVAGFGSLAVTVTLDSVAAGYGVHQASIHVKSNDPDEPDVRIPVTFTVLNASNRAPVAQNQSLSLGAEAEKSITLTATDLDGNPLTYAVLTLPANGLLFGSAPNLVYAPFPGYTGSDSFTFKANDGYVDSNAGTITLATSSLPNLQVSPATVSVSANVGEVVTRTLTVSNTGTAKLSARIWNQTSTGGANPQAPGAVLRTLNISGLYPAYSSVHPEVGPLGIAFDGSALWVASVSNWQRPESVLFKLDPMTGQVLATLDLKGVCDPEQLSWDGANLWATNFTARKIYLIDVRTKALVRAFSMPPPDQGGPTDNAPRGLVRVGNELFVIGEWTHPWYRSYWIYRLDASTGAPLGKYLIPNETLGGPPNGQAPFGLAYFNGSLWMPTFSSSQSSAVYELKADDGTVRGSFAAPDLLLMGMSSDCERGLWVAARTSRKVYLLDTGELGWLRVQPRSLSVDPGGSATVTLTIDSAASGAGSHASELHLESNDPTPRDTIVPVTLSLANLPPVADAGADQIVPEDAPGAGATVYLNGHWAKDPDGTISSYVWKEGATQIATGVNPGVLFAVGTRVLTLTVTDNNGATASDSVTITVGPLPSGTVYSWGNNGWSQLGDGTNVNRLTPIQVSGPIAATSIGAGGVFSVALKPDQSLWAWGDNWFGQIGDGTNTRRFTPVAVSGMTAVRSFSTGYTHVVAAKRDRTVWTWGGNDYGQLGDGTTSARSSPAQVAGLSGVVAVVGGWNHTLALKADGTVWAWGKNQFAQLGDGTITQRLTPVAVSGLSSVIAVAAGGDHSLALKSDGTVWAWGYNGSGQLGGAAGGLIPTQVTALSGVKAIACGYEHSLVLRWDGTVWGFGYNNWGQLGDGTTTSRSLPVQVSSLSGATAISTGYAHSMAVRTDGTAWAWGRGWDGDLGDGGTADRLTPVQVSTLSGAWSVVASKGTHSLAFLSSGSTFSISGTVTQGGSALSGATVSIGTRSATTNGSGSYSIGNVPNGTYTLTAIQPGLAFTPSGWSNPVVVSGASLTGRNFTASPGAGGGSGLVLVAGGSAWSWGNGYYGQLGDGRSGLGYGGTDSVSTPLSITSLSAPPVTTAVAAGGDHSLARKADGTVWSWGRNLYGQLGDGTSVDRASPILVSALSSVVAVSAGANHSVALKADGTVWAWGRNNLGQLGDGSTTDRLLPVPVSGLASVVFVAAGADHTLAVKADGTAWAWGSNGSGRLGDGTTVNRSVPVQVSGLSSVTCVSAGMSHSLALKSDGTVWAWGNNFAGQLGISSRDDRTAPVQVTALSGVTSISAGLNHSLALLGDGTVWSWGFNTGGQISDGLSMTVPPTVGEGGFTYSVQFQLSAALSSDLVIALQGSDPSRLIVPASATISAGSTWGSFEIRTIDNSLQEGVQKVVITATSSLGTISANTFIVDDESFVTQGVDLLTPKQVAGLAGVLSISAGGHSLALKSDGTLWAWGLNQKGELGDGTSTDRGAPVQVSTISGIGAMAAGWYHSLALNRETAPFQQDAGADGLVTIEVEHYHSKSAQGGHDWTPNLTGGASGDGALVASPNNGAIVNTGFAAGSPRLDFQVNFGRTGTHIVWVRGIGPTGSDDSCHIGLDGVEVASSDRISTFGTTWTWSNATMDAATATINVGTTGIHTINLWMREDGFVADRILLTTNAAYVPSGSGPIESPRLNAPPTVSITSPAGGSTFVPPASITINATASDPDGTVAKVEFFQGVTKIGEDTSSPFSLTWTGVGAGAYSLQAVAIDDRGASAQSGVVNVVVNTAPLAQNQSVTTPQGTPKAVTLVATDADGQVLAYSVVSSPSNGALSGTAPNLTYTPNGGFTGTDSFTFKANDGFVDSNVATVSITVSAPPAAGPFQQDAGPDGILSIEAEHYETKAVLGGHDWTPNATSGFSGEGALQATPNNGAIVNTGYAAGSPRLDFKVNFVRTGTHYVWIRGIGPTGSDDSCHAGLDGAEIASADRISTFGTTWTWSSSTMDGVVATINVAAAGAHTVNLWMREDGFIVDKVLLTTNSAYVPSGLGPNESARSAPGGSGTILREYWTGIPGTSVADLTSNPSFPNAPSGNEQAAVFEGPIDWADNYGTRFRGYVHPPVSGNYVFWVSGDDSCELWLGTNDDPATRQLIATVPGWTSSREWTKYPQQQSAVISLVAGQKYFIEALHKEGAGGDNIAVGWQLPDSTLERPIPGNRLSPFVAAALPAVSVTVPDASAAEAGGDVGQFLLSRTGDTSGPLTVNVTLGGTATNGSDFNTLSFPATIPGGQASTTITITPIDDSIVEGSETVIVTIASGSGYAIGAPSSGTVTIADNDSTALPPPWQTADIGAVGIAGSASYSSGMFTVQGSGADIWDAADAFRYVYQTVTGDIEIRARVVSLQNTDPWAKAGVMVRETLTAGSAHAMMVVTPSNGHSFQRRMATGGASTHTTVGGVTAPTWVRLVRQGNLFSAYGSPDGTNWTLVGSETIAMAASVYVGLPVTSHNNTVSCSATFDAVAVLAPNVPPSVSLTSPSNGASFTAPASISIQASASDSDGSVVKVEFFQGTTKIGESLAAPWQMTWSGVGAGSYGLTAKANDNAGAVTTSAVVSITVSAPAPQVLFVVGNATLPAADAAVKTRLEGKGYVVTVKSAVSAVTGDATGKSLVVISSTVASGDVNTKFRTVAVPVLNWESALMDDLGMTGTVSGTDYGTQASQTALSIVNASHAMAAGLSGTQTVVSTASTFTWGVPNANAVKIATINGNATRALIFGYLSGAAMPGLAAPARRVGFFLENATASSLTAAGWSLFDAAVEWSVATGSSSLASLGANIKVNGEGDYSTLEEAIDAARPGDTVGLGAMHYFVPGGVTLKGGVSIRGVGPRQTILDGQGAAAVLRLAGTSAEGRSIVEGLTLTGGTLGIDTGSSSVLLRNLQVVRNTGDGIVTGQQGAVDAVWLTVADNEGNGLRVNNPQARFRSLIVGRNGRRGVDAVAGTTLLHSTLFGNVAGNDTYAGTIAFRDAGVLDYREADGSVNVDSGDPSDPFDREPIPNGGRANQGAYGNTPDATPSSTPR